MADESFNGTFLAPRTSLDVSSTDLGAWTNRTIRNVLNQVGYGVQEEERV